MHNVKQFLTRVNSNGFRNNTQKVLFRLLEANGRWILGSDLNRSIPSATSRARDLRKPEFGSFKVECRSARELHRAGGVTKFFYRIQPREITVRQVASILITYR